MAVGEQTLTESRQLRERLEDLEATQRATLNVLEDFDEEKKKLSLLQRASLNLLEDLDAERRRFQFIQTAMLNLLEDASAERDRLAQTQLATMNLLEDLDEERGQFQQVQTATINILEDANAERERLAKTQQALMNILDDVEVERIKAERANTRLEAVNRELEAFSYSVSHDLRSPLRAISGFVQALAEDCGPQLDSHGNRYLGLIADNAHRMGRLIDDLLTFSRLGRQQMIQERIEMQPLVQTVFSELAALSPDRAIEFRTGLTPPIHGDRAMIRQVLVNLLANAIKFTRTRENALIEFGYDPNPNAGAYYVKDNGVGFDMRYVVKLFGVFQRLHDVEEFEGTGVGLALVYRIITRHGGRVWATGEVDRGATFFFALPEEGEG
jgi:signal transduction histidine kinase